MLLRLGLGLGLGLVFYLTWRRISFSLFVDVGARRSNLARSAAQSLQTLLHARDGCRSAPPPPAFRDKKLKAL